MIFIWWSRERRKVILRKRLKFAKIVCNKCHDLLKIAYTLRDIAILNAKGATFRCILMGISKNEGLKRLNNSTTYDRGVL